MQRWGYIIGRWAEESFWCACSLASHSLRELSVSCFLLVICKLVLTLLDTLVHHKLWLLELAVIPCGWSQRGSEEQRRRCGLPWRVGRLLSRMLTGNVRTVSVKNPCSSCMRADAHMATRAQHIILRENTPAWFTVQPFVSCSVLTVAQNFHLCQWKFCI